MDLEVLLKKLKSTREKANLLNDGVDEEVADVVLDLDEIIKDVEDVLVKLGRSPVATYREIDTHLGPVFVRRGG